MSVESHADELPTDHCGKLSEALPQDNQTRCEMLKTQDRKSTINKKKTALGVQEHCPEPHPQTS